MNARKDYYQILGVLPSAEDVVIRAAFRALAQRYHPDRFQGDPEEATARMQEIIEAHTTLCDPARRQAYDQARSQGGFVPGASAAAASVHSDYSFQLDLFRALAEKLQEWGYDEAAIASVLRTRGASPPAAEQLARLVHQAAPPAQ